MQRQGLPQFRAWMQSMGLGAREAGEYYKSGNFDKMIASMEAGKNKTIPDEKDMMHKYYSEARSYQNDKKTFIDNVKDSFTSEGVKVAIALDYFTSGDFEKDFKKMTADSKREVLKNLFTIGR